MLNKNKYNLRILLRSLINLYFIVESIVILLKPKWNTNRWFEKKYHKRFIKDFNGIEHVRIRALARAGHQ